MVLPMPSPYKHPVTGVYWLKQRVPSRLVTVAKGKSATVTVDGMPSIVKLGDYIKISLRTKNVAEAKQRAPEAEGEFNRVWLSFESGPVRLTLKQITALAGEMYHTIRAVLEEDPGEAAHWAQRRRDWDAIEARRKASPRGGIMIGAPSLEARLGSWVDGALAQKQLYVDEQTRQRCLVEFDRAASDLALLLERRGQGDFSSDATGERFPQFEASAAPVIAAPVASITFNKIIEAEATHRAPGREAKGAPSTPANRQLVAVSESFEEVSRTFHKAVWPASVPVVVIAAEQTPFGGEGAVADAWRAAHQTFVEGAPNRKYVTADKSSHETMVTDSPDIIRQAISDLVAGQL